MNKSNNKIGYLMIFIAGALWGSVGLFVNILKSLGAESSVIAFLRLGVGAIILVPFMFAIGRSSLFRIDKRGLFICMILGIFSQGMFNFSYNEAISSVGVATASVLLYTAPIFVCIMSRIFFKEEINNTKLVALAINIFGCILTVTGGDFSTVRFSPFGVAAGIAAGFLYGSMTIISKVTTEDYQPLTILFYSFLFGAAVLAVISKPWENIGQIADMKFIAAALGYGLIPTVGAYCFYMKGLRRDLKTSKVPIIASIETVVAAVIGITVFSEPGGMVKVLGISCVVLSIGIMNLKSHSRC